MVLQREVSCEVRAFMLFMAQTEDWDMETAVYFLEKPWKWQREFDAWLAAGMPERGWTAAQELAMDSLQERGWR